MVADVVAFGVAVFAFSGCVTPGAVLQVGAAVQTGIFPGRRTAGEQHSNEHKNQCISQLHNCILLIVTWVNCHQYTQEKRIFWNQVPGVPQ